MNRLQHLTFTEKTQTLGVIILAILGAGFLIGRSAAGRDGYITFAVVAVAIVVAGAVLTWRWAGRQARHDV